MTQLLLHCLRRKLSPCRRNSNLVLRKLGWSSYWHHYRQDSVSTAYSCQNIEVVLRPAAAREHQSGRVMLEQLVSQLNSKLIATGQPS